MHFYPEQDWTKLSDLTRNCFSFRFCTCRKAMWSPETFGNHCSHGLPSWHPAVRCQTSAITAIVPSCLHRNVQYMYEKAFTHCPTPVAAREAKISVEIKYFMINHRRDQTQLNRSESSTSGYNPPTHVMEKCRLKMMKVHRRQCLCKLQLHLLFPARVLLQQDEPLQHAREWDVFLRCKLRTFRGCQSYGCLIGLETRNCARLARLSHDIDSLKTGSKYRITPSYVELTVPTRTVTGFGSSSSSRVMRNRGYIAGTRK
jgi:hypothetical protein